MTRGEQGTGLVVKFVASGSDSPTPASALVRARWCEDRGHVLVRPPACRWNQSALTASCPTGYGNMSHWQIVTGIDSPTWLPK
jgi:hypothetical protein